jgi:hypothetical protein
MDEINAIRMMPEAGQNLDGPSGRTETHSAVTQCCHFFRQSGWFDLTISCQKIGTILSLDGKMVCNTARSL